MVLMQCQPYPGDEKPVDSSFRIGNPCFFIECQDWGFFCIYNHVQGYETDIHIAQLWWYSFSIGEWFAERCAMNFGLDKAGTWAQSWLLIWRWEGPTIGINPGLSHQHDPPVDDEPESKKKTIELGGIQVNKGKYPALQWNAAQVNGNQIILLKPIVMKVTINGHPAWALLDSSSLGDFMSTTLADQLGVKTTLLDIPFPYSYAGILIMRKCYGHSSV